MKERIRQIMESEHLTPSAFADYLQLGRAIISHILNGRNNPSLDVVTRIVTKMNHIDPEWLLTGSGEMYKEGYTKGKQLLFDTNVNSTQNDNIDDTQPVNNSSDLSTSSTSSDIPDSSFLNPVSISSEPNQAEYYKEIIVEQPQKTDENLIDKQIIDKNRSERKITKIIIYYSNNTFESFNADDSPL